MPISILVISYNSVLRHQLERFLAYEEEVQIKDVMQKLTLLSLETFVQMDNPIVVWAMRWPLCEDIELLRTAHGCYPDLRFIVISPLEADDYETVVLEAGGTTYLTERNLVNALIPAIHHVRVGARKIVSS